MGSLQTVLPFKLTATEALIAYRGLAFPAAILEGRAERRTVTARTAAGTAAFARPAPSSSRMAWPLYGGSAGTARPCRKPSRKPARAFDRKKASDPKKIRFFYQKTPLKFSRFLNSLR